MRALVATLGILLPLTSCMPMAGSTYGPQRYDTALRARLTPGGLSTVSFYVNRPAHVAVFEISPGNSVQMLYPRYGADALALRAGSHTVWRTTHRYAGTSWASGLHSFSRWGSRAAHAWQPRIFYLIASEQPLRVSPWMGSPLALQNALAGTMLSRSQYSLMEEVTRLVVPNYHDRNWVSDVYVEWPEPAFQDVQPTPTRVIVCADGRRFIVPAYITSCPQDGPAAPPTDTVAPERETQPQRPDRRRPEREEATPRGETDVTPSGAARPERDARGDRAREPQGAPAAGPRREAPRPARETRPARPERGTQPAGRPAREASPPRERPAPSPPARSTDRSPPPRSAEPSRSPRSEPSATRAEPSAPRARPAARPAREDRSSGSD
jgi:hypothetical protein